MLLQPLAGPPTPGAYFMEGTVVTDGSVREATVVAVRDDRIVFVGTGQDFESFDLPQAIRIDLPSGALVIPGLVDLHCHGAVGGDFSAGDVDPARRAADFLHRNGTTTLLGSLVAASPPDLLAAIKALKVLVAEGVLEGIHLEGPFLSSTRCGAQNPDWLRSPDLQVLQDLLDEADGSLKTMTFAPELSRAENLVKELAGSGVIPSLGHTDCEAKVALEALKHAASLVTSHKGNRSTARPTVTHLFNGMPPLHHRLPGPVASCLRLARRGLVAVELIGDGVHLDPDTVAAVFELVGHENVILVTDSMAATGLADGDYLLGSSAVSVAGGVVTLGRTGSLAGGTATLLDVVRKTVASGIGIAHAVSSATAVPAKILDIGDEVGSLKPGMRADILAVNSEFELLSVWRHGQRLSSKG